MLTALMNSRALPAGELSGAAGVTPSTDSGHLGRLLDAGLLVLERQGRHRCYRLASAPGRGPDRESDVADQGAGWRHAPVEAGQHRGARPGAQARPKMLRASRGRAGRAGRRKHGIEGQLEFGPDGGVTDEGLRFMNGLGADLPRHRRAQDEPPHIAGLVRRTLNATLNRGSGASRRARDARCWYGARPRRLPAALRPRTRLDRARAGLPRACLRAASLRADRPFSPATHPNSDVRRGASHERGKPTRWPRIRPRVPS